MHSAPNLVRLFSFVSPSLTLVPLNDNALSRHGGRIVSMFSISIIRAYSFRFLFVCMYLVDF